VTATVVRGDARNLPLPDASVDLIVTSPPYWALRSYTDAGEHYQGQIGAEPTPAAYIDSLIECTREWMRVLKPSGSIFVNLGDKYSRPGGGVDKQARNLAGAGKGTTGRQFVSANDWAGPPEKSLIGLPWRYALRCIDDLGLILRAEVIWSKPNGLPESVTDRVRRSHEQWFHMVKSPRYFSAVDAIREAYSPNTAWKEPGRYDTVYAAGVTGHGTNASSLRSMSNPLGKLPGSVWTVATQPLKVPAHLGVDHFAAYPLELPRRIVLGWSPSGICTACGEGRRPVVVKEQILDHVQRRTRPGFIDLAEPNGNLRGVNAAVNAKTSVSAVITGEACACPDTSAPTRPAVVVDPFGGTGTTALVAHAYGRHGVSVDMSADYCRLAAWRTSDPGQLAAALEVEKPAVQHVGQLDLFDGVAS
jgi:DNA modification methylase